MRCFVSVEIPEELKENIAKIQQNFKKNGIKLVEKENLHFTLKFLGEIDEEKTKDVATRLGSLKTHPFPIVLRGIGAFPNERFPKIIWVGCQSPELENLAGLIDSAMFGIGFVKEKNYKNHITIARVKQRGEGLSDLLGQLESIEIGVMNVEEICLKQSVLGRSGPKYADIKRFKFIF